MTNLLAHLTGVCRSGEGWTAHCPAHDDHHQSLSVDHRDGKWLINCHAGCAWEQIIAALGLSPSDLFEAPSIMEGDRPSPLDQRATVQPSSTSTSPAKAAAGLTLDQYVLGDVTRDGQLHVGRRPHDARPWSRVCIYQAGMRADPAGSGRSHST